MPQDLADPGTLVIESGEPIKSIEVKDGKATVGAYAIRFSGPDEKDLTGEYFTAKTYLGSHKGDGADVLFNHGQAPTKAFDEICSRVFSAAKATADAVGVFVQHVLDLSDGYEKAIADLCSQGKLKWSSGTASHLAKKSDAGEILRWPISEFSYTPTPAEPRLPAIVPLKSVVMDDATTAELAKSFISEESTKAEKEVSDDHTTDSTDSENLRQSAKSADETPAHVDKAEPPESKVSLHYKEIMPTPTTNDLATQEEIDAQVKERVEAIKNHQTEIDAAVKSRVAEVQEIYAIAEKFGKRGEAAKFVDEGKSLGEFQNFILGKLNPKLIPVDPAGPDGKKMRRRDFDTLSVGEKSAFLKSGGKLHD